MILDILINEGYLYHQLTLTKIIFDNEVQFINDQLHQMSEYLIVLGSNEIKQFNSQFNIFALLDDVSNNLSNKLTNVAILSQNVYQIKNLFIGLD